MKFRALKQFLSRRHDAKVKRAMRSRVDVLRERRKRGMVESLEPRMLMATINYTVGDPLSYTAANPGALLDGDIDLTLRVVNDAGTPTLQLVDMDKGLTPQVVGSAPLTEDITVNITGYSLDIDGHLEEVPESLLIDFAQPAGLVASAVSIDVTLNGIKGTLLNLLQDDEITIAPSGGAVYAPANLDVTLNDGGKISVSGNINASGNVTLDANQGLIEVVSGGAINAAGNIVLAVSNVATATSEADSPDVLVTPSAAINVNGGSLTGNDITLQATATGDVTISATDLSDGQFSVGGVIASSSANVTVDGNSQLTAAGVLTIGATSDLTTEVTRGAEDDGDASDDDKDQDAAIAISAVTASAGVHVGGTANLTAGATANITAINLVHVTTTADGSLHNGSSGGSDAGGTLATATVVGDTVVLVDGGASITAVGDLNVTSTSNRQVVTTSKATPQGATDDGDSSTKTAGQQSLADNNASTSDGAMTLAAAIAVNTVMGETRALINGASLTSSAGTIEITSSASHDLQAIADGTTATGDDGTGVGIAVAIGLHGVTDPTGATGLRSTASVDGSSSLNANAVNVKALAPVGLFTTQASSGGSGPSEDENGNDTGADVEGAGALAIGVTITNTNAQLAPGANVTTNGGDVSFYASGNSNSTVKAFPNTPAAGESLAIGAGVAVNITDHSTRAAISDNATLTGADDVALSSGSLHLVNTEGKAGAAGGTAIAAAVAYQQGNHDTIATIGTGTALNTAGNVSVVAVHLGNNTAKADGNAEQGSDVAFGAALSMSLLTDKTEATIDRSVTADGSVVVNAVSNTNGGATAKASAKGEDKNKNNGNDPNSQAAGQRGAGDGQASSRGARDSQASAANPDASTSEGSMTIAAAIAFNLTSTTARAAIADKVQIDADGSVSVTSTANADAMSSADGSASQSKDGVGAAVAINAATAQNIATIGNGTVIQADGLVVKAYVNDAVHSMQAHAVSGAGAEDVGIAGSLAINLAQVNTLAIIQPNAVVNLTDGADAGTSNGNLTIEASSITDNQSSAKANATGGDVGVGASVAFNIADHDTRAVLADDAVISGAVDVTIQAQSKHDVSTQAEGGAAGGTAITPVATASLVFPTTEARIGTQAGTLSASGKVDVSAIHTGTLDADAKGKTEGEDAAIGASLAFTYVDEHVTATIERNLTSGGSLTLVSRSDTTHTSDALASASGAAGEKDNQGGTAQEKSDNLRASGNSKSSAHSGADSGTDNDATATTASKDGDKDGDAVTVAAAIAVSIVKSESRAEIVDGLTIHSGGLLTVKSLQNADSSAIADGQAVNGDVGVGAAVAINKVKVANQALIGTSNVTADGLVVEARMIEKQNGIGETHEFLAQATSGAGGKDVGIAGSLSINHLEVNTSALVLSGAVVTLADGGDAGVTVGPVSVQATSLNDVTSKAIPAGVGAQSDDLGIGASVALNLMYDNTTAEIQDGVSWGGASSASVTIDAKSDHDVVTKAENGAKTDGVGIGGAVAVAISKNHTTARVGNGPGSLQTLGAANIHATHDNSLATDVSSAASGSDAAIGASVGVVIVEDTSSAELARDLTASGSVSVQSQFDVSSLLNVKASAGGGDSSGNDADTESTNQANQPNASNNGNNSNTVPAAKDSSDDANTKSEDESSSSGGGVGIAASVAVNALSIKNTALISSSADVTTSGSITVSAPAHVVSRTEADSSAIDTSGDVSIGAAVALNWVSLTNSARVGSGSTLTGDSIKVEAATTGNQTNDYTATAFAVAGNTGDAAVAGVLALNVVDADTIAMTADDSHLVATGNVDVTAEHAMRVQAGAIAGAVSDGVSVAAAVAINLIGLNEASETGGSRTVASIGNPDATDPGATVDAGGAVHVSATHTVGMFPTLNLPKSLNEPKDPDDAIADIETEVASVAVSGGGGTGKFAAAGSASLNLFSTTTIARVDKAATIDGKSLDVTAHDTTNLNTLAGAVGVSTGGAGIGLGLDLAIIDKVAEASIGADANVTVDTNVAVATTTSESLFSIAATLGVGNNVGAAGSASVQVLNTSSYAGIDDGGNSASGASVTAGGAISVTADGAFSTRMIGGAVGAASSAGVGATNTTLVHNDSVVAQVGDWATVNAGDDVVVHATSQENLITIAAAGGAAGTAGVAGAAVVNVLNETTHATVGSNATLNLLKNNAIVGTPDLDLLASDMTTIVSVAGSLAAAGTGAAGIGADVATVGKDTQASIGSNVTALVEGNILVDAKSFEDVTSAAAGMAVAGTASFTLDASVHVFDVKTRAFIGDDPTDLIASSGAGHVHATGNILVAADDQSEVDKVVGVLAVSGTVGVAGGAAVSTVTKTTEAFIGQGAKVTGDGQVSSIDVPTGRFVTSITSASSDTKGVESNSTASMTGNIGDLRASGEIGLPDLGNTDGNQDGKSEANDPSLKGQRTVTPELLVGFHGVAVTATNRDDIEDYTVSLAGSAVAVAISAGVNVISANTRAYVGTGAQVNEDLSSAGPDQSVHVAAGNDFSHVAFAGSVAVGGYAGIAPAADVTVLNNSTAAMIGWDAKNQLLADAVVKAKNDVSVEALGTEDILLVGVGVAAAAGAGIGAGVNVLSFNNVTDAAIGPGSLVFAGGDVVVRATDDSDVDIISGGGGGGIVGIGGSVGVLSLTKDTNAWIGDGATVDGRGAGGVSGDVDGVFSGVVNGDGDDFATTSTHGVIVQASSTEDILHLSIAIGVGFVGVAGGVAVNMIDSDTTAEIGAQALINQTTNNLADDAQSVYVNAANEVRIVSFAGAVAGGAGALGGAVDYGTLKNDTLARINADSHVAARDDVEVNGLGIKDIDGIVVSGSGGAVALAGAVSIWSIGTPLRENYSNEANDQASASQRKDGAADDYATSQSDEGQGQIASGLNSFQADPQANSKSSSARLAKITGTASGKLLDPNQGAPSKAKLDAALHGSDASAGTSAIIGDFADVVAGDRISVEAKEDVEVDVTAGGFAAGLAGIGASVGVLTIAANTSAYSGGNLTAVNAVQVRALLDDDVTVHALAGAGGFVGLGAAVMDVSDASTVQAAIGSVHSATTVSVLADSDQDFDVQTGQLSFGGLAAGASFTSLKVDGSVTASVLGGAQLGQGPGGFIGSLNVLANSTIDADNTTLALAFGAVAVSANFARAEITPDVKATVGFGATMTIDGSASIKAVADHDALAEVKAYTGGAVAIGASLATAKLDGTVGVDVAPAASLTADSVTLEARLNHSGIAPTGGLAKAIAHAPSAVPDGFPSISLLSGTGAKPEAIESTDVTMTIGDDAQLNSTGGNVTIRAWGSHVALADALAGSIGLLGTVGLADAHATANGDTTIEAKGGMTSAGAITVAAAARNHADAHAEATSVGGLGVGDAGANAVTDASPDVKARINGDGKLLASGALSVTTLADNQAIAKADGFAFGLIVGVGEVHTSANTKGHMESRLASQSNAASLVVTSTATNIATAEGFGAAGGFAGAGQGVEASVQDEPEIIAEVNGKAQVLGNAKIEALSTNTPTATARTIELALGAAEGGASADVLSKPVVRALVSGGGVRSSGTLTINAHDTSTVTSTAGAATVGGAAQGNGLATNVVAADVQAGIVHGLHAGGTISITATESGTVVAEADGRVAGGLSLAGGVATNDIQNVVTAEIFNDVFVNQDVVALGDIVVAAKDTTNVTTNVDQHGVALLGASGSGMAYTNVQNDVRSRIADHAFAATNGSILVTADENVTVHETAVGVGIGAGAGVAGNVAVNTIDNSVEAYIRGTSFVAAGNNLLVQAQQDNKLSVSAASVAGGIFGEGGTVVINTFDNSTRAFVDELSNVSARGQGPSLTIKKWDSAGNATTESLDGLAVIASTLVRPADDPDGPGGPLTPTMVSAHNVSGGFAGTTSINVTTAIDDRTEAFIASSTVNSEEKPGDDVIVRAHSDHVLHTHADAVAGGAGAIGGASVRETIDGYTRAFISDVDELIADQPQQAAIVYGQTVDVNATSRESIELDLAGATGGGFAVTGAISIAEIDVATQAFVRDSQVRSLGDLSIVASDKADIAGTVRTDTVAGFAGGASIAFNSIANTVQAQVLGGDLYSAADLLVQSNSDDTIEPRVYALGAGLAALAGSVAINTIETTTEATVANGDQHAQLNAYVPILVGNPLAQYVTIQASDHSDIVNRQGTIAAGAVGIGAAVEASNIRNRTVAEVGPESAVNASHDIRIEAHSDHELDSNVIGGGHGLLGLSGAVSLLTLGGPTADDLTMLLTEFLKTDKNGESLEGQTDSSAKQQDVADAISDKPGTPGSAIAQQAANRVAALQQPTVQAALSGNSKDRITGALVNDAGSAAEHAHLNAGGNLTIDADHAYAITQVVGTENYGLAAIGASIAISTVRNETTASLGNFNTVEANGNVTITADDVNKSNSPIDIQSLAQAGGFGTLEYNEAVLTLDSHTTARIGQSAEVQRAEDVVVNAGQSASVDAYGKGFGASALASAGSVKVVPTLTLQTTAEVEDLALVGVNRSVRSLDVSAITNNTIVNTVDVGQAAALGGVSNGEATTTLNPTTTARIGAAEIEARGLVNVDANGQSFVTSKVQSLAAGLVGDGAGTSVVTIAGNVKGEIATQATLAVGSLQVLADQLSNASSAGQSVGGGLVGEITSGATADIDMDVLAMIGDADVTADGAVEVLANSASTATATGGVLGVIAFGAGGTVIGATIEGSVTAETLAGATVHSGGDIWIHANAVNSANATAATTAAGFATGSAAETLAKVDVDTRADADQSELMAARQIRVEATATNTADAESSGETFSAIYSEGHVHSAAVVEGSTRAFADGSIHSATSYVRVQAIDQDSHAVATTTAANGGIGGTSQQTYADAFVRPSDGDTQAQVYARLAGDVTAAGGVAVRAKSTDAYATATADGISLAGAFATAGTKAESILGQTVRAAIGNGSNVTTNDGLDVKVEAIHQVGISQAYASATAGSLILGASGSSAKAQAIGDAAAVVGDAVINAGGELRVHADSNNMAKATGDGIAVGLVAGIGDVRADAIVGDEDRATTASINAGATVTAQDLTVESIGTARGITFVVGTGAGIVSDQGALANTQVISNVNATIGSGVVGTVTGDVSILSQSKVEGDAESEGNSFGALGNVSDSKALVTLSPAVTSTIGQNAHLDATGNITVEAISNGTAPTDIAPSFQPKPDGSKGAVSVVSNDGYSQARAAGAAGSAFLGIQGSLATVTTKPIVQVIVVTPTDDLPPSLSADGDVTLKTSSRVNVDAQSANDAVGILGAGSGQATAGTVTFNSSVIDVQADAKIHAGGNLTISANGRNVANADGKSTGFGAIGLASVDSYADIDYLTSASIGAGAQLDAAAMLSIASTTNSLGDADAIADAGGAGALTSANDRAEDNAASDEEDLEIGKARRGVRIGHQTGLTTTSVGDNAVLTAQDIALNATIARTQGQSTATADSAGFGVDSDSLARVELWDDAELDVGTGAQINAVDSVLLQSSINEVDIGVYALATSTGVFAGASATVIADSDNDATVNVHDNGLITTHDLQVKALVQGVSFPNLDPNKSNEKGSLDAGRMITFDGDAVLSSGRAVLVVGLGGVAIEQENIDFHLDGNKVVVHDIVNDDPGSVLFQTNALADAPQGIVRSQNVWAAQAASQPLVHGVGPTFTFVETFDSVKIENHSQFNLVVNDIQVVNKTVDPEITIDTQTLSQVVTPSPLVIKEVFGFDVKHSFDETQVMITDPLAPFAGDILLDGVIDNPIGQTEISNVNGGVANLNGNATALVRSNELSINATGPVGTAASPLKVELVESQNRPVDLDIVSGGNVDLDLRGIVRKTGVSSYTFDVGDIQGGNVNVTLHEGLKQATLDGSVSYLVDVVETQQGQTTPVENRFRTPQPPLDSLTDLPLGIFGVNGVAIDSTYQFDKIEAAGSVGITGQSVGKKIHVDAATNLLGAGKVNASTNGNLNITETAGNLPVGAVTSSSGNVTLASSTGDILDADNDAAVDVSGVNVTLHAPNGSIGTAANALEVNSSTAAAGEINADAKLDLSLVETAGDLNTGVIASTQGHVTLATAAGSIVDAHNDSPVNVSGKNVSLGAKGGASAKLGETNDPLEICATGVVTLTADGGIPNVKNLCGGLKLSLVQVNLGTVSIAGAGNIELVDGGQIVAPAGVNLEAAGDVLLSPTSGITSSGMVSILGGAEARPGTAGAKILTGGTIQASRFDVSGGAGHDQIVLKHSFARGTTQTFGGDGNDLIDASAQVDRVFARGGSGDDTIFGGGANDLLWGDDGADRISGGGGNDVLVGGNDNDTLLGDAGRDLLFGGYGADLLDGGEDDDFLLGGVFKLSENSATLDALVAAWGQGRSYNDRVAQLRKLGVKASNIIDDRTRDQLLGGGGADWFWDGLNDTSDRAKNEKRR